MCVCLCGECPLTMTPYKPACVPFLLSMSAFLHCLQRVVVPHQSTKCASCGAKNKSLKCSRCKQVVYCGPQCQSADWKFHRPNCELFKTGRKQRGPETVGCPFILSLPESQCNYDNIVKMAVKYARCVLSHKHHNVLNVAL